MKGLTAHWVLSFFWAFLGERFSTLSLFNVCARQGKCKQNYTLELAQCNESVLHAHNIFSLILILFVDLSGLTLVSKVCSCQTHSLLLVPTLRAECSVLCWVSLSTRVLSGTCPCADCHSSATNSSSAPRPLCTSSAPKHLSRSYEADTPERRKESRHNQRH